MITETKKADASTSAISNLTQKRIYRERDNQSSRLKEKIGRLLLCLLTNRQGKDGWKRVDRLLRLRWERG